MNIQTAPGRLTQDMRTVPAPAEPPIRSNFLPEDRLRLLGASLARGELGYLDGLEPFDLQKRNEENAARISDVYIALNAAQTAGETVTPAAQWLLDNHYLVAETVAQISRDLPRRFYRELPVIKVGQERTLPRALALAWVYVAHCDSAVNETTFRAVVEGYQTVEALRIGELWALPSLLRFVLIENLRRLALRVKRSHEMRLIANALADQVLRNEEGEDDRLLLAPYAGHAGDTTFATQLLHRLRDGSRHAGNALSWLQGELERGGSDAEEILFAEHQTLSSGNVTTGNIVRGLRAINDVDWTLWFEAVSRVDALLRARTDFERLDFPSRDQYRAAIENLSRHSGRSEPEVAARAIEMAVGRADADTPALEPETARHDIGFFLVGHRRPELEQAIGYRQPLGTRLVRLVRSTGWLGIAGPVFVLTAALIAATAAALAGVGLSVPEIAFLLALFVVPASEGALGFFNAVVLLFLKPTRLIGYEYKDGVPESARTLIVMPSLIGSRDDVEDNIRNLEVHHLANMKGDLHYALLSDWPDSDVEQSPDDLELLGFARAEIEALNGRYPVGGPRFHLLHRRRVFNEAEGVWMGWERKRGKLHELNLLLRGDANTTFVPTDVPVPRNVAHVMTLDADTRMTRDAVTRLVGKLSHPLNRPRIAPDGRIAEGYGILQPRVTPSLTTGDEASFFQRVFSVNRGLDPYVFAISDFYQDVFGDGSFTGKGLYHVDAVEAALKGRIPENAVLSHDLLEGAYAKAALVTDVELIEDYPTSYAVDASRHHRWARGDWQLLPFILDPTSGVPSLSRWKMVDNLRRSVTPIFWVIASIAGWAMMSFAFAVQWQALLILSLFMAPTFDIIHNIVPKNREGTVAGHFGSVFRDAAFGTALVALRVVLIAHGAWMMADAIGRTLYRLLVSRRHLLEWRTASQVQKSGANSLAGYFRLMRGAMVIATLGLAVATLAGSTGAALGLIFAAFWGGSPAFAWLISRSAETEDRLRVAEADRIKLRRIARRTWHYFETFVTAEHHDLPPDNYQERPSAVVANRTSPTNVGVYLLSVVSARDFGWIGLAEAASRIEATLRTIEDMERFRGHLYNWYDTTTLRPLHPLYISSVDSGNLAGHLIAVSAACREWADAPAVHLQGDFEGILDAVGVLEEGLAALPDDRRQLRPLRQRLRDRLDGMRRSVDTMKTEPELASIRTINLTLLAGEIRKLAVSIHAEAGSEASEILSEWSLRLEACCEGHVSDAHTDERGVAALRSKFQELEQRARKFAFEMDFAFLLRRERKLLSIGYRVEEHQLDESCYDLLASEARLTSLFGIAKGDIPTEHWFRLGRPIVEVGYRGALLSWSGSMFEYLMPPLVMKEPRGGILNQTSKLVIRRQMHYARAKGIPWGISEAAYNARDREMTYQYSNFGVPGLGLKRGLSLNTVIAPYATALAAQFTPAAAVENLERLRQLGALGRFGYYDAVDFTPERVPEGATYAIVYNYMAHHQGMSVVAVADAVFEGRMRDRFHSDPVIEAAELLLQEKAPRVIPVAAIRTEADERVKTNGIEQSPDIRIISEPATAPRAISMMSNGRYSVMLTATGSGSSRWNDLAVTRWQPDPVEDRLGTYLFLRDVETSAWWSATAEPRRHPDERSQTLFADDKATFIKTIGSLRSEVECIVVSEGNGEGRRITLWNDADADRHIEVTSYAELALAPEASDSAHPAFSKMFVETQIGPRKGVVFATRRKRSPSEADIVLAHLIGDSSSRDTEAETDRRAFLGRGRSIADPAAFDPGARLGGGHGFTLDPIVALRQRVRVPANQKVSLTFWTVTGANRAEVEETIARLDHPEGFARQAMLAWTRSQVQTRHIGLSLADAAVVQKLAGYMVYPNSALRVPAGAIAAMGPQSALWPTGISGDFPIFAVRIADPADLEIVAQALRFQEYLRGRGLLADLVVINERAASYIQDLQQAIEGLCENGRLRGAEHGPRQHIFAVRRDLMDDITYRTLIAAARVVLHTRNGTILDQIERAEQLRQASAAAALGPAGAMLAKRPGGAPAATTPILSDLSAGLAGWNGFGGFDRDGSYIVRLTGTACTPHPWINVVANENFGFHTSAEGASFTWSRNSRDFPLTPWSNDPVANRPGEAFYIHDHASGAAFSPLAAVLRDPSLVYEARHAPGVSTFTVRRGELTAELTQLVDPADPVKLSRLRLVNHAPVAARLTLYGYAEWVLGNGRGRTAASIVPARDAPTGALLAHNPFSLDFSDRVAFLTSNGPSQSFTTDRAEFLGTGGSVGRPQAVLSRAQLSRRVDAGVDPCAALACEVEVPAEGEMTVLWALGDASSAEEAGALAARHLARDFGDRLAENERNWGGLLGTLQVETPDPAFDAMTNRWLPYQSLACRIRARSAFYQASGAFGFRDQLQDTLALLLHDPRLARAQILNAAGRQFPEGDVQHWWLPRTGAGVRTMISDDVVWLGHAAAHYVAVTGDASLLDETVPFLEGRPLAEGEHDAFYQPSQSEQAATVYEHCARALDLALRRTGATGLPLILGGDWNDGMNRVGEAGRGESVWLGWFLLRTLLDMAPIAEQRGDVARAKAWRDHAMPLKEALENAWDGAWYRRGSYDDGSPLGSHLSDECRIDSIAQSWSVLSGEGDAERSRTAMQSAMEHLVDPDAQLVRLFTPAFNATDKEPGYIKAYPPGVRENGGQYTHAATWFVIALAKLGRVDDAYRCFSMLNPASRPQDPQAAECYRVEPYVVAADIYSGDKAGRGGWTWYTGSAGWLYRAAVETILGIRRQGGKLFIDPAIPSHWPGFAATLRFDGTIYRIKVERHGVRAAILEVDGVPSTANGIALSSGGEVDILVRIPREPGT